MSPLVARARAAAAGLRRRARPRVHALRRALAALGERVRPPVCWNGRHLPELTRLPRWEGRADGRFHHDFLGVRTDPRFRAQAVADPAGPVRPDYPEPDQTYLELAFVLDAVAAGAEAGPQAGPFVAMELGAGYGPWLVTVHHAMAELSSRPVRLVALEMEPRHVDWLHQHLRNNGIDPASHRLLHGAVSGAGGRAAFRREPHHVLAFGQRLARHEAGGAGDAAGEAPGGDGLVWVRCWSLAELLRSEARVDLLHVDVQGQEWRALRNTGAELGRVRRMLVATHSGSIHRRVRRRLRSAGWQVTVDYRPRRRQRTPVGDVRFLDGLLGAVAPRDGRAASG